MKILDWSATCNVKKVNGLYVLDQDVWLDFEHNTFRYRIQVDKGAMTDGLSVPNIFQWYLPAWDEKNPLYNIAGVCHDGAYGSQALAKSIADELFYQGLITAGVSKFKAKTAKWAVEHLAGLHYGREHDDFGIGPYVSITP